MKQRHTELPLRRIFGALVLAIIGLPALTLVLVQARSSIGFQNALLVYLLVTVLICATGGVLPAAVSTIGACLALDWYFAQPYHSLQISGSRHVFALITFVLIATTASGLLERSARRVDDAQQARSEADAAEELARSNELRAALLQAVSHDLRTPLSTIKAAATSLLAENVVWSDEAERSMLQIINTEADRLNAMVADLLDMSRIRTGAVVIQPRPTSVEEILVSLLELFATAPEQIQLHIPDGLPLVVADPTLLERVLANVTENALAFSPEGTQVQIAASSAADSGRVQLSVIDLGPGIPLIEREKAFRPFQRLGDTPHGKGVGLGLAVASGFVQAMKGTITIEETTGGGTTMVIDLPAEATAS